MAATGTGGLALRVYACVVFICQALRSYLGSSSRPQKGM